jgi:hypothetical protein
MTRKEIKVRKFPLCPTMLLFLIEFPDRQGLGHERFSLPAKYLPHL